MTGFLFALMIVSQPPAHEPTYGQVYFKESQSYVLPRFSLDLGYAKDVNNTFLDLHSFAGNFQFRVWKYFSTGVMGQWIHSNLTHSGKQLRDLSKTADILFDTSVPNWGIFSLSDFHLILGKWNVLNLLAVQVDLIVGGGAGILNKKMRLESKDSFQISYLWSVEQRVQLVKHYGIYVSFFGHRDAVFVHPGIFASF